MQEFRNNPVIMILLAILVGALTFIGSSMNNRFDTLWTKLDRVTAVMMQKEDSFRAEMRDIVKMSVCHDRDIAEIRERLNSQIKEIDRLGGRRTTP